MLMYILQTALLFLLTFLVGCLLGGWLRKIKNFFFGPEERGYCCGDPINWRWRDAAVAGTAATAGAVVANQYAGAEEVEPEVELDERVHDYDYETAAERRSDHVVYEEPEVEPELEPQIDVEEEISHEMRPIQYENWDPQRSEVGRVDVDEDNTHYYRHGNAIDEGRYEGNRARKHIVWDDKEIVPEKVEAEVAHEEHDRSDDLKTAAGAALATAAVSRVVVEEEPVEEVHRFTGFQAEGAHEDLSLIRDLDNACIEQLNSIGIYRYEQLASVTPEGVAYIKENTRCGYRIHQENWIEQAQLLARGDETLYAKKKEEVEGDHDADTSIWSRAALAGAGVAAGTAVHTLKSETKEKADSGERMRIRVPAAVRRTKKKETETKKKPAAKKTRTRTTAKTKKATAKKQRFTFVSSGKADDLTAIKGLSKANAAKLKSLGIIRYDQLANLSKDERNFIAGELGVISEKDLKGWRKDAKGIGKKTAKTTTKSKTRTTTRARTSTAKKGLRTKRDDLRRISGIGTVMEKKLNLLGVTRFDQIAEWGDDDVHRVDEELDFRGRIEREEWIEQAQAICKEEGRSFTKGKRGRKRRSASSSSSSSRTMSRSSTGKRRVRTSTTSSSSSSSSRTSAKSASSSRSRSSSASKGEWKRFSDLDSETRTALASFGVTDFDAIANWSDADIERFDRQTGLGARVRREGWVERSRRYVRSKARRKSRKSATTTRKRSTRSTVQKAVSSGQPDDLKRIRGIGSKIEEILNDRGITRFAQIAEWDRETIKTLNSELRFRGRIQREKWVKQAKVLAKGGETEFSKRVDKGEVPSSQ